MLISVKASWAEAEHEREVLKSKMHTIDEVLREHYEGGLDALLLAAGCYQSWLTHSLTHSQTLYIYILTIQF